MDINLVAREMVMSGVSSKFVNTAAKFASKSPKFARMMMAWREENNTDAKTTILWDMVKVLNEESPEGSSEVS